MGKTNKNTKKFIHKGGLKQAIAKRPVEKKIKEAKVNKLHKAREYDANEKETKFAKDKFRMDLEKLISQKKKLPAGEEQLDISEFLQKGFDSDDDFDDDISDDDGGDLEFGNEGQQVKGGKKKGKGKKQVVEDDLSEGEEFEDEGEDSEGGDMDDAEMKDGEEGEEGEEMEDDDEGLIEDEGAAYDEADENDDEEEGGDDDEEGGPKKKKKIDRKDRKKMIMERNLKKLMGEDGSLSDLEEEVDAHRQELKGLKESDPSFFDYLAKEGKDVLDFDKLSREMKEKKQIESGGIITVTSNLLHTWIENAIEKDSIEEVKKILTAFQVSVMTEDEAVESQMPFRIGKETVYNELIVFCLEHMTDLFYDLLGDAGKNVKPTKATDTPNQKQQIQLETIPTFGKIKKLVYIYANVVLRLLEDTSDANMLSFVIKHLVQFIPFISTSASHSKKFLQALLRIWASPSAEAVARMSAFICLRQLALFRPFPFINTVLRGIYLIYMHNCKSMSSNDALNSIAFMRNCVVEMYGIDFECSYQHMFTYLRQLAVTLQKALVSPSQDSLGQVYSWQYLNALQLWSSVLSAYPNQQNLTLLIYPLVQVIQGSLTLDGSPRYYPYRIHLIRMLNTLALANSNTFINSLPFTLDLLNGPVLQDKLPQGDKKVFADFKVMRKATENILHTKQFQDELLNQITELLATNLSAYAYSISFPEYSTFAIKLIGEYIKDHDEARSTHLGQLLTSVEQNSVFIRRLREKSDKAPKEITNAVKTFFSPTLKNVDKAPVVLFQTKFTKQVEKWESILEEKRKKLQIFNNNDSDNEEVDDSDDDDEEESKPTKATNGAAEEEDDDEDDDEDDEEEDEDAETPKKKNKKQKKEEKIEKPQELKRKKEVQSLSQFGEDVVGDIIVSDDDEEEVQAPKKKVKTDKSKSPKKQNGTPTKTKGDKKPKKKN